MSATLSSPQDVYHLPERALKRWLLHSLYTNDLSPFDVNYEVSTAVQLQRVFDSGPLHFQESFKSAVVRAIVEWRPKAQGYLVLRKLTVLAAYIRASSAMRFLGQALFSGRIQPSRSAVEFSLAEAIVGVLAGFAASEESRTILETLFFSNRVDYRLAGQMLNGLCACSPEHYPRYLQRYFFLYDTNSAYFRDDLVFREFFRVLSPPTLARHFRALDSKVKVRLLELIEGVPDLEFWLLHEPEAGFVLVTPDYSKFPLTDSGSPDLETLRAARDVKTFGIVNHPQGTTGWLHDLMKQERGK